MTDAGPQRLVFEPTDGSAVPAIDAPHSTLETLALYDKAPQCNMLKRSLCGAKVTACGVPAAHARRRRPRRARPPPVLAKLARELAAHRSENGWPASARANRRVAVWHGDATELRAGVLVNSAHAACRVGGGLDGAIHHAAGPSLLLAMRAACGLPPEPSDAPDELQVLAEVGKTLVTPAFELEHVGRLVHVHVPSPLLNGDAAADLAATYDAALAACWQLEPRPRVVALPTLGVGTKAFNRVAATHVALARVRAFLDEVVDTIDDTEEFKIVLVVFEIELEVLYNELLQSYFPPAHHGSS